MPNYKQLGKAAGYAMKYADKVSEGTFREDAPAQKFVSHMGLSGAAARKQLEANRAAAIVARSGESTATTKPVARSGKWKPGDPKYPAWVGTGGSGSGDAYLLKGNVAMQNWIESSKQKSWPKK